MWLPFSTAALGVCFVALGAALAQAWVYEDAGVLQLKQPFWPSPPAVEPTITVPELDVGPNVSPGFYMATLDRPLFAPDRRAPPPPDAAPQAPPPDSLGDVNLLGLLTGELWSGAILSQGGKVRRIQLGQSVADWTLTAIDQRNATFSRSDESRVLVLVRQKAPVSIAPRVSATPAVGAPAAPVADAEEENRARMIRLQQLLKQQNR